MTLEYIRANKGRIEKQVWEEVNTLAKATALIAKHNARGTMDAVEREVKKRLIAGTK